MSPPERPGDEDPDHRQLGDLRGLVAAEQHELPAVDEEDQADGQDDEMDEELADAASMRGLLPCGRTSRSKWVPSRTAIMAPIMMIQTKQKRATSSVQM